MRESQYLEKYLRCNETEPRYTVGTYLHYELRGKAKKYGRKYERALKRALDRRALAGEVEEVRSAGGRVAYVRVPRVAA